MSLRNENTKICGLNVVHCTKSFFQFEKTHLSPIQYLAHLFSKSEIQTFQSLYIRNLLLFAQKINEWYKSFDLERSLILWRILRDFTVDISTLIYIIYLHRVAKKRKLQRLTGWQEVGFTIINSSRGLFEVVLQDIFKILAERK